MVNRSDGARSNPKSEEPPRLTMWKRVNRDGGDGGYRSPEREGSRMGGRRILENRGEEDEELPLVN